MYRRPSNYKANLTFIVGILKILIFYYKINCVKLKDTLYKSCFKFTF